MGKITKEDQITALEAEVLEWKTRSDKWEKNSRDNAVKITLKFEELRVMEQERITDIMTVRGEWNKSEEKMLAQLNTAKSQAEYWEETWGELAQENVVTENTYLSQIISLQAKIIELIT